MAKAARKARAAATARAAKAAWTGRRAKNAWHLPTRGYHLTARFGDTGGYWGGFHTGLDFAAPERHADLRRRHRPDHGDRVGRFLRQPHGRDAARRHRALVRAPVGHRGPARPAGGRWPDDRRGRQHRQHDRPARAPRGASPTAATPSTPTRRWSRTGCIPSEGSQLLHRRVAQEEPLDALVPEVDRGDRVVGARTFDGDHRAEAERVVVDPVAGLERGDGVAGLGLLRDVGASGGRAETALPPRAAGRPAGAGSTTSSRPPYAASRRGRRAARRGSARPGCAGAPPTRSVRRPARRRAARAPG